MRASRLLSILMLLQSRGRLSAEALAREVEVSVRTVYRDVDQLSASGIPVLTVHGPGGGFELLEGWRTRLTGLTPKEAQAMFLAGAPSAADDLGLGDVMASAQLKLLAALPAGWEIDARRVGARFHLDTVAWYRDPQRPDALEKVAGAVWNERRLKIRYESWKGSRERVIDPLGLVLKAGEWYAVARVDRDVRTYRVANIRGLEILAETFQRPKRFELAKYWAESTARFEAELYRDTAIVRASPLGLRRLSRAGNAIAQAVDRTALAPDADGWRCVTIPIESIDHAALELLRFGPELEVIEPIALREKISAAVLRWGKLYR